MQNKGNILKPRIRYTREGFFVVKVIIYSQGSLTILSGPYSTMDDAYRGYWIGI